MVDSYFEKLVSDIREKSKAGLLTNIETVYIGGGTPSFAGSRNLSQLLYALGISMRLEPDTECTVECNPDSLDERLIKDIWALGANRLSIGVQSFDDALLAKLGRPHTSLAAQEAIDAALSRFGNVSIDLICGIPGQTIQGFENDLEKAVSSGVKHVSVYPLTVEEGTTLASMVDSSEIDMPSDDLAADMMVRASEILGSSGFERYEVASYAMPGYESRHNLAYWTGKPYLGIGDHAASMRQSQNRRQRLVNGEVVDDLDAEQMLAEDLMLAMRTSRGISVKTVEELSPVFPGLRGVVEGLRSAALVLESEGRYRPTEKGWLLGNVIYGELMGLSG